MRFSAAMSGDVAGELEAHLLRPDGQEDVIVATYRLSTGASRTTAVLSRIIPPRAGERMVHGNASFTGGYVLRAASDARERGEGIVLLHSHPRGGGWQFLSAPDHETESEYSRVAQAVTKVPLVGMTLGGSDGTWSARFWLDGSRPIWTESVRVVSEKLSISWNDSLRPVPNVTKSQVRTVSAWGARTQASIARTRVLVVGVGSVGLDIAQRLAATGLVDVGSMDFDTVETLNLDRMIGATRLDAALSRPKVDVATRLARSAATAQMFRHTSHNVSLTEPAGLREALDYDVIFSCVDRPWPRAVLNSIAYADLIPVIDGGLALDAFDDGSLRGGIWRAHTIVPGRPCMACIGQLDLGELSLERSGLLDDPTYIEGAGRETPARQNVAAISASVSAALLAQFVSLTAHPGGRGVSRPLRHLIAPNILQHLASESGAFCAFESQLALGDGRTPLTGAANEHIRKPSRVPLRPRAMALLQRLLIRWSEKL